MSNLNSSDEFHGRGNNITLPHASKNKQISPCIAWAFTFNNYTEEIVLKFQEIIDKKCKIGFFNKEVGESGTPHLQGYIEFHVKGRPLNIFPKGAHWTKARNNMDVNFKYCNKECVNGSMTFIHGYKELLPIKTILELRPFQKSIEDYITGPINEGKIFWVYDQIGQLGKTDLLRYLHVKYGMPFSYGGKKNDIINLVFNAKDYLLRNPLPVMLYNFCRETDPEKISYGSMEQISDGAISNTKFETGCFVCNKPHVVVLSNCLPKMSMLTSSRWIVKTINKDTLDLEDYVESKPSFSFCDDEETVTV